jgi:hypothetical protein
MSTQYDEQEIYCRKLGHFLTFDYCRQEHQAMPCAKIRDCWFGRIDIDQFLADHYSEKELTSVEKRTQPKIFTILELIEQAKKNAGQL